MFPPLQKLLTKLNAGTHQVTYIISEGFMPFTADAAYSLGISIILLWAISACGLGLYQFKNARERGLVPLKVFIQVKRSVCDANESYLTTDYLDNIRDRISGMRHIRLTDLPSRIRIMDPNDTLFDYFVECTQRAANCIALVPHSFDDLEQELVNIISSMFSSTVYTIGPQQLLVDQMPLHWKEGRKSIVYSLWEEEKTSLQWLDSKEAESVV
ncbi:hypothetical protein POM88_025443 [Heracleum sosnowskyi]|uniref:Uncharacterized protein n=1 Tax=Heracleum sosnowskyi TaxID=360622 RepID=A0AAD8I3Z4_9APIA|nr:hypothetical protein POM88_025443 [Heracleum sosnowskyi]